MNKLIQWAFQGHRWLCTLHFKFLALIAIIPVVIFKFFFIITYSLNNSGGDTSNYFNMMLNGKSSLVHASGYPFLFGFYLNNLRSFFQAYPVVSGYLLLITQHLIETLCMLLVLWVLYKLYNAYVAILSIWLWGINIWAASATSSVYPEWFQSVLLMTFFCLIYFGFKTAIKWEKVFFYCLASVVFLWCYLVKFNALYFLLYFCIILFVEKINIKTKLTYVGISICLISINLFGFLIFYHVPSTGSFSLSYDHGWVLADKVSRYISPDNGTASKRILLLNALLPPTYSVAGPVTYSHVKAVPNSIRQKYRGLYDQIMSLDENELEQALKQNPLPDTFKPWYVSVIVAYYVGLPEGDKLGIDTYLDFVRSQPLKFSNIVLSQTWKSLTVNKPTLLAPTTQLFQEGIYSSTDFYNFGFRKCGLPGGEYWNAAYWNDHCIVWWPGVRVVSVLQKFNLPAYISSIIILIGFCISAMQFIAKKKMSVKIWVPIIFSPLIFGFVLFSNMIFDFRWKELELIFPLINILCCIGLDNLLSLITQKYKK